MCNIFNKMKNLFDRHDTTDKTYVVGKNIVKDNSGGVDLQDATINNSSVTINNMVQPPADGKGKNEKEAEPAKPFFGGFSSQAEYDAWWREHIPVAGKI